MDGRSRAGAFGGGGQDSDGDPFGGMRNFGSLGRGGDMFSHPSWGGFSHGGAGDSWTMDDPMDGMEGMRPRPRPKFSSATTMMGPRPFQRERRASAGPPEQAPEGSGRERIIPIQVERDEADGTQPAAAAAAAASPRQQRPYTRRGTMDAPVSTLKTEELQRDARARSAPPDPEPKAAAAARVPPLNVQAAAAAATPHKPNYFNSSPKPFSTQQRPFHTPSFGQQQGQIPIPVHVERATSHQQRQQPHHHHPHHQQHQQQQEEEPRPQAEEAKPQSPPPPPPKPKSPKERAVEAIEGVQQRVVELSAEVEAFSGKRGDKQHLYLDEMLMRELLKLDNVEANGDDEIRTSRKQTIMSIQKCLAQLEARVTSPEEAAAKAAAAAAEAEAGGTAEDAAMDAEEGDAGQAGGDGAAAEAAPEVEMKPVQAETQPAEGEAAAAAEAQPAAEGAPPAAEGAPAADSPAAEPAAAAQATSAPDSAAAAATSPAPAEGAAAAPAGQQADQS